MSTEAQMKLDFAPIGGKSVEATFDGGNVTSDAGVLFLRAVDQGLGLIRRLAAAIRDPRYVDHALEDLLRQRVFQIAQGYEDATDCNDLRGDPAFKVGCERAPLSGADLASQPTMSRLENSVSRGDLYRLAQALADAFIASYTTPPQALILDVDDTDDPTHGAQQGSLFNAYYGEYCFMPLHIYEGQSGKRITTILRPGVRPTGAEIVMILKRVVAYLRQAWPSVALFLRGDSHFSAPEVHAFCEAEKVEFVLGQGSNAVLQRHAAALLAQAQALHRAAKAERPAGAPEETIRLFTSFPYQADTWEKPQRIVAKVEVSDQGYQVQIAETCHPDNEVQLLSAAVPQTAAASDTAALPEVLDELEADQLLPESLLADTLYGSDDNVQHAKERGVALVAPTKEGARQAEEASTNTNTDTNTDTNATDDRLTLDDFTINAATETVERCPEGHAPERCVTDPNTGKTTTTMPADVCSQCLSFDRCPMRQVRKIYRLEHTAKQRRLAARRREEQTDAFRDRYRRRGGIEGTNSGIKRRTGMGRVRVRGKTRVFSEIWLRLAGWNILRAAACPTLWKRVAEKAQQALGGVCFSRFLASIGHFALPAALPPLIRRHYVPFSIFSHEPLRACA